MKRISFINLIGKRYDRFVVVKEVEPHIQPSGQKKRRMLCRCDCGNYKEVRLCYLQNGHAKSCGCLQTESRIKHRLSGHPLYWVWHAIKQRCYNPKSKVYKDYGKRGITLCGEWQNNVEKFIKWCLKNGWGKGLFIDRIDNDGNYKPNNCRFVDAGLNNRNKRLLTLRNKSGYRGVYRRKKDKKWIAAICVGGKSQRLGCFDNPLFAALRYDAKAIQLNDGRPLNFTSNILLN